MNKNIVIPLIIIVIAVVAGIVFMTPKNEQAPAEDKAMETLETTEMTEESSAAPADSMMADAQSYTMADVEANATAESCYTAVDGKVYDVTAWIDQHPGGADNILKMCGIDASAAFNGKHGESAEAMAQIENFYIGDLTQ